MSENGEEKVRVMRTPLLQIGFDDNGELFVQTFGGDVGGHVLLLEKAKQMMVANANIIGPKAGLSIARTMPPQIGRH